MFKKKKDLMFWADLVVLGIEWGYMHCTNNNNNLRLLGGNAQYKIHYKLYKKIIWTGFV